jgi:hypothetical protein
MPNFFLSHKRVKVAGSPAYGRWDHADGLAPDLKQTRRDPAQGPPDSATKFQPGQKSANALGVGA